MIPPPNQKAYRHLYEYLQPVPAVSFMRRQKVDSASMHPGKKTETVETVYGKKSKKIIPRTTIALQDNKKIADVEFYHPLRQIRLQNNLIHGYAIHEGNISKARS